MKVLKIYTTSYFTTFRKKYYCHYIYKRQRVSKLKRINFIGVRVIKRGHFYGFLKSSPRLIYDCYARLYRNIKA